MTIAVSTGRRAARSREIEERVVAAAHDLFVRQGYARTTLTQVADAAGVAERTVYVRFGTKAALLNRVIGVALVGDVDPVPVKEREWVRRATSAPTLAERITELARGAATLMQRAADVLAVGFEVAGQEPELAEASQRGREGTLDVVRTFWASAARDGLLPHDVDRAWLTQASSLLVQAEGYLLGRRTLGWTPSRYRRWLERSLTALVAASGR
jgi:AcrR family transcriptional regulator